jgi:predicted O-methyltransferase YrrM
VKPSVVMQNALSIPSLLQHLQQLDDSVKPAELVDLSMQSPAIAPQQIYTEFLELAEIVKAQNCKYVLEIGTYRGGTLFVFSRLSAPDATIVSVEYHFSFLGKIYRLGQKPFFRKLIRRGQSLFLLRMNSHSPETLTAIKETLQGNPVDLLFIDGDHSYAGVRQDFEMYSPLVRSGGVTAFHDIAKTSSSIQVPRLWNEIKQNYKHKEIVHRTDNEAMGIGVLWM